MRFNANRNPTRTALQRLGIFTGDRRIPALDGFAARACCDQREMHKCEECFRDPVHVIFDRHRIRSLPRLFDCRPLVGGEQVAPGDSTVYLGAGVFFDFRSSRLLPRPMALAGMRKLNRQSMVSNNNVITVDTRAKGCDGNLNCK